MNKAKKLVIGLGVFGTLAAYSLGIRHEQPQISKPLALAHNNNTTNTAGTTSSMPYSGMHSSMSTYKDGTYTGTVADAYYGNVQVQATVSGGKITNVKFDQYPNTHQTSVYINQQAMPYLEQEAIQAQNSNVQIVTGATFTSQAFIQSLASALSQA